MSIGRFLHEFQPLFRALDEPFRSQLYRAPSSGRSVQHSPLDDPFFNQISTVRPAVDLHEEGNVYRVEAELPGVPKENINVSVGEGGQSVTIEGSVSTRKTETPAEKAEGAPVTSETGYSDAKETTNEVAKRPEAGPVSNQLSAERTFTSNTSFSRTVWLPTPVDPKTVIANLNDGILTVTLNKANNDAVKVTVE